MTREPFFFQSIRSYCTVETLLNGEGYEVTVYRGGLDLSVGDEIKVGDKPLEIVGIEVPDIKAMEQADREMERPSMDRRDLAKVKMARPGMGQFFKLRCVEVER